MATIGDALDSVVAKLSDENYAESIAFYRLWFDIGQTYLQITSDQTFFALWNKKEAGVINTAGGEVVYEAAPLILRFAGDVEVEAPSIPIPHNPGLRSRLCATSLREFFSDNLTLVWYGENRNGGGPVVNFYANTNLIAHWVNLGYVGEAAIRDHILQSLISHSKLYDHQADALVILFKLAGATFAAYTDPLVVDHCLELLRNHKYQNPYDGNAYWDADEIRRVSDYDLMKKGLVQEVVALRECGWEGLPPPPMFPTGKPTPSGSNQKDPTATPIATFLGLPSRDLEPHTPQLSPPEPITAPESDGIPASPTTSTTHSPSTSIATLSDFTTADVYDDESHIDPAIADVFDDEPPTDPGAVTPHQSFYLEDGNVEVLCGNTLFRVHTTILSFHSPALRQMFAQTNLATAESPNGCPRILSSDAPKDFTTLLKMIYLPGFPEPDKMPDFTTFSSLLRITAKYELPTVRSQLVGVVRDAYPEAFEGLGPSKQIGEGVFSGPTPHPNEVLNLFVQQNLTSALPMAYYMAVRRGSDSLMDRRLPASARLSPEILQVAIGGLMTLREVELNETGRLISGPKGTYPCSVLDCPSRTPTGPAALEAYKKVFDHIVGSSRLGTNVLQVPEFYEDRGGDVQCVGPGICDRCVERWESGHAELRKKVWATLPDVFGLRD